MQRQVHKKSIPVTKGVLRTDNSHSVEHKRKSCILERYGFNMVTQFPLDVMHLVDLGIGKLIVSSIFQNEVIEIFFPARPINFSLKKFKEEKALNMSNRHS